MSAVQTPGLRAQFLATLRAAFTYSGRSTRSQVINYYLGFLTLTIVAAMVLSLVPFEVARLLSRSLELILIVPAIALFVRRMHDQDRSGWWVMLPIALLAYSTTLSLIAEFQGAATRIAIERGMRQLDVIPFLATLGVLALTFAPGTVGPNRFGPDPRA